MEKEDITILSNGIIAYSSFIGILSAIIYYIADKGISNSVTQIIIILYILVFLIVIKLILKVIKRDKNEDRN